MLRKTCGVCLVAFFLLIGTALAAENAADGSEQADIAGGQEVSGQTLSDAAVAYIRQRIGIPADSDTVDITLLHLPQAAVVPDGTLNLTVELPYGVRYSTPTNATVTIAVDGRTAAQVNLLFAVKYYQQVVVAAGVIEARELLTADRLRYERVDTGRLAVGYITDINKAVGLAARRQISPGTVMNQSLLVKPVLIKRGNVVTILARKGTIEVSAPGQALQDGVEGQLIKIQNLNSRKIIVAKVLNDAAVLAATYNGR